MNIGDVSVQTGLPAKTIRYYEDIGFVTPERGTNGYRVFANDDVRKLSFLQRARALGFSIDDCRQLLLLRDGHDKVCPDIRTIAQDHLGAIEAKISGLVAMRDVLAQMVCDCVDGNQTDCPILRSLEGGPVPSL